MEQVNTDDARGVVYFPPKLGFIRMAIKHGVPMLPVYAFGENQLFKTESWTRRLNRWFYKNIGTGSLVLLGRWGIPHTPLLPNPMLLPEPTCEMHVRYGELVEVGPPDENPSEEKVQGIFNMYVAALQELFDKHKATCLPPEVAARGLTVVWRGNSGEGEGALPPLRSLL